MKHLKIYELFGKKRVKDSNEVDRKYLYDNGFGERYYICSNCDSYKLKRIFKGGMQPPDYKCENCGQINYAPRGMSPEEYKEYIEDKKIKASIKKYNI